MVTERSRKTIICMTFVPRWTNDWGRISHCTDSLNNNRRSKRKRKSAWVPILINPYKLLLLQYIVLFGVVKKVGNKIRRFIKAFERIKMAITTKRLFIYLFLSFKAVAVHSQDQVA